MFLATSSRSSVQCYSLHLTVTTVIQTPILHNSDDEGGIQTIIPLLQHSTDVLKSFDRSQTPTELSWNGLICTFKPTKLVKTSESPFFLVPLDPLLMRFCVTW